MSQWDGKSKGTVLGYKIFVFFIKKVGIKSAYLILYFVATYYFIFLKKSNTSIFYYFRKRLGYSYLKSKRMVFNSYYTFGQTIIDKIAIGAGLKNKFTYEHDGGEIIIKLLKEKRGGVLISAHIGNFEIAEHFFSEVDVNFQINLVTTDLEHSAIKKYLESITQKPTINFILIGDDLSHIFEINSALARNELVCFTGDRYFEGVKSLSEELLGEDALFPAGPFLISSRLKVPVVFVYVMKEPNLHYHLYTREATVKYRDEKGLLKEYAQSVETMVRKYPLQWFNYFDFWNQIHKE
ncbi:lipid A biosynthesis acyltransferase [Flavobacterium sp. A45]|uniref:LpxL/LpxP family acyltransferase n=1 Tax=Flavobacterium sp. A45 TaxID=1945862 RepID=UPI0009853922|nr:lipid A biosynthesis acyltransferase [Flavobacterium sp. A45]OOG75505.1 lipid A biosynthesis acyltransferase [Flavobacterium sp. A45]